jgi:hypothetical protein
MNFVRVDEIHKIPMGKFKLSYDRRITHILKFI